MQKTIASKIDQYSESKGQLIKTEAPNGGLRVLSRLSLRLPTTRQGVGYKVADLAPPFLKAISPRPLAVCDFVTM
ncbi:MAG: hypothetical protein ACR2L6_00515, partial [Gemmatimonadaceae bacterium]